VIFANMMSAGAATGIRLDTTLPLIVGGIVLVIGAIVVRVARNRGSRDGLED